MKASKPEECNLLFQKALQEKDIEAMLALYEPNANFILDSGESVTGLDEIRKVLTPFLGVENFKFNYIKGFPDSENTMAILRGSWVATAKDDNGNPIEMSGNDVEIVRRQADGSWRFAIDHPTGANAVANNQ
jgi:uncharacterized protein (TIGR02246 family)